MRHIVLIAHNIRSTHNVGALLRTCEGLGVSKLYLTGYTPYPAFQSDGRLPHEAQKLTKQISKVSLGAERTLDWAHAEHITGVINRLHEEHYEIIALEQGEDVHQLYQYTVPDKVAIVVGREVEGIESEVLHLCDKIVAIPMFGKKESFNVVQAAGMALYHCRFYPFTSAK
jgi:tRNA G18 (ribose-2'-O)-methylase SpoU